MKKADRLREAFFSILSSYIRRFMPAVAIRILCTQQQLRRVADIPLHGALLQLKQLTGLLQSLFPSLFCQQYISQEYTDKAHSAITGLLRFCLRRQTSTLPVMVVTIKKALNGDYIAKFECYVQVVALAIDGPHLKVEESESVVMEKCKKLAAFLRNSKCTLVYTGAGISTAASIPDYRGPNGVWTLAEKGITLSKCGDPVQCCPTTSHMVLKELCRRGIVRHILSQNCDGLHLRSGVPQKMLSEIHGNMHIEVCTHCDPPRQFIRPFDVTQKSQFRRHGTGRTCTVCNSELVDTIVHFGEVGRVPWPLNWKGVTSLIDECDLILCVGTSLAVLKQYQFLWPKAKSQTQIAIVNLQWTPKDRLSCLKINARCDTVFEKLAKLLSVPVSYYCRDCDPVLNPRRNARICELRERLTDCSCHLRIPRSTCSEQGPRGTPGWWAVGIQKTMKRSLQSTTSQTRRAVGRPRKRKKSCIVSRRDSLDEKLLTEKLAKLDDSSSLNTSSSEAMDDDSSRLSDFAVNALSNDSDWVFNSDNVRILDIGGTEFEENNAQQCCIANVHTGRCDGSRVADGNRSEISQDLEAVEFEVHRALDDMLTVLAFRSESMLPERDVEWASVEACVTDILDNFNVLS